MPIYILDEWLLKLAMPIVAVNEMADGKPTAAFILTLIGGVLVLIGSIVFIAAGSLAGSLGVPTTTTVTTTLVVSGVLGIVLGIVLIVASILLNTTDMKKRKLWSIIAIILAIISLVAAGGGFIIGFILALIGGILGLVKK